MLFMIVRGDKFSAAAQTCYVGGYCYAEWERCSNFLVVILLPSNCFFVVRVIHVIAMFYVQCLISKGDYDTALALLRRALKLEPDNKVTVEFIVITVIMFIFLSCEQDSASGEVIVGIPTQHTDLAS